MIVNTAVMIVLVSFLFMISGCAYYKIIPVKDTGSNDIYKQVINELYPSNTYPRELYPESNLDKMFFMDRQVYAVDSSACWFLSNPYLSNDTIFSQATLSSQLPHEISSAKKTMVMRYQREQADILKRVNLYSEEINIIDSGAAQIPVSSIFNAQIYKKHAGKTAGIAIGTFFIVLGVGFIILAIIAIASSCPFIYVNDGTSWQFAGEIYGGAVYPSLERDDYLALPGYDSGPGSGYKVKIANMLREIQYINQADLVILQHDSTTKALIDKYGDIQTIIDPLLPSTAIDSRGNDCLEKIAGQDGLAYDFSEDPDTLNGEYLNSLEMSFNSGINPDSAKIYIKAKNSFWGDRMMREFFDLFGDKYMTFVKKQAKVPAESHIDWLLNQGLLLQVYVMKGQEWQPAEYFNMVGAFANREMALPLDLNDAWTTENKDGEGKYNLKIKLESAYKFWELDYAAIDLTHNSEVKQVVVKANNAIDQEGKNVGNLLSSDDDRYLVQKSRGDETILDFTLPETIDGEFSIYLHSKGYYQQADENKSKPEVAFLKTFLEPGRFSVWSFREYYNKVAANNSILNNHYYEK